MKPGASYVDIQTEAFKTILTGLKDLKVLLGDVDEMYDKGVHSLFMPHHLGHYIGYLTHDVGLPNVNGKDTEEKKMFVVLHESDSLKEGMAITVEPGIYFIEALIENSKTQETKNYIDYDVLDGFVKEVGGIRIEDDLLITDSGSYNCTDCPRTVEEIEACMNGDDWKNL